MNTKNVNNLKGENMNITLNTEATTDEIVAQVLPTLLDAIKQKAFVSNYKATDEEALGVIVSKFTQWNAGAILAVTAEALEDANFDNLASQVDKLARS